jgi:repressor of nif and glnA expression
MFRDWEIIREILLRLEDGEKPNEHISAKEFKNFEEQSVAYNIRLLAEAGFIEAKISNLSDGSGKIGHAIAVRLTNSGHDLLDTIRNDTIWNKITEKFSDKGLNMTFDLVISVGKKIIESLLS